MEGAGQGLSVGGVTVLGPDAPSDYHVAPRTEAPTAIVGLPTSELGLSPATGALMKKKRGRPRKYGPDGTPAALSPNPITSSAPHPPVIDFSAVKRGKIRPPGSVTKAPKMHRRVDAESSGDWVACSVGANFTPHMIDVNTGEDVTMKVISFAQQRPRVICILSASGLISSVTFRQPDSCGGTLTYEGRFEILSLAGSFMPSDIGGMRSRAGGMSVSLACPDGRVLGGAVAGLLVAANPVQIVVGSFLTGNQQEQQKTTKQIPEFNATISPPTAAVPISSINTDETYEETQEQRIPVSTNQALASSAPFRCDTWSSIPADMRNKPTDINMPPHG
uniref:AT-hook motif nuclear-localized protein n=1 Tax=Kalanchoe fedtschenkoi TaxID=63787 RepID=A0A7N0SZ52_KALFE